MVCLVLATDSGMEFGGLFGPARAASQYFLRAAWGHSIFCGGNGDLSLSQP